jgi:hypothetical protein
MSEDHGYDNHNTTPDSVYNGEHRITEEEAESYGILFWQDIDEISGKYSEKTGEIDQIYSEVEEVLNDARSRFETGEDLRELSKEYVPQLVDLKQRAENVLEFELSRGDNKNIFDRVKDLQHKSERWKSVLKNHDRQSVDFTGSYKPGVNTVLDAMRKGEEKLEKREVDYMKLQNDIDEIGNLAEKFPEYIEGEFEYGENKSDQEAGILETSTEDNIEWSEEELREHIDQPVQDSQLERWANKEQ